MKRKLLIVFIVVLYGFINLQAQSVNSYKFSLNEARIFARENNKLIKNARLSVVSSEKRVWQSIAQGLPQADISMNYTDYFNYELEFSFGTTGEPPVLDYTKFDSGDLEILKLLQGFTETTEPSKIILDNQASAKFQVNQLIFNGQYYIGIKTAKIAKSLTEQSLKKTSKDVAELVSLAYFFVLLTEETIKIIDDNIINLEDNLSKSQALLKAGITEQTDIDQIKMALSMIKNTRNSMSRSIEFNYNSLRFQLGLEPDDEVKLTDSLNGLINETEANNILIAPFNLENNIDYQIMNTQVKLSDKMIDLEKMSYLPTIAGFYSYNKKILTTDFDMNPRNLAGVNMSWPLFSSGLKNAKVQEAKIELEKTRTNKRMIADQLLLQEKQYRHNLKNSLDNYRLQKENVELADNLYKSIERKYNQGIISSLDLTQANDNYLKAQNNYITSVFDVLQSKLALNKLLNKI